MASLTATIENSFCSLSVPEYVVMEYSVLSPDATCLIILDLLGLFTTEPSYRVNPRESLTGKAYAIDLAGFSISCNSANYNASILNIDDESRVNTINEVLKYTSVNLSTSDAFDRFIIRNRDVILNNKLYLLFQNSGGAPGTLRIELIYCNLHDRT